MVNYDIVIIGGGTAGCAAAYTAGKLGFKALLIEKNSYLGGAITGGLVVPAMKAGKNQINTDFFNILCEELNKIGGQITYQDNKGWFNPELTKIVLDKLMKDAGVDVVFGAEVCDVSFSLSQKMGEGESEEHSINTSIFPPPQPSPSRGEGGCDDCLPNPKIIPSPLHSHKVGENVRKDYSVNASTCHSSLSSSKGGEGECDDNSHNMMACSSNQSFPKKDNEIYRTCQINSTCSHPLQPSFSKDERGRNISSIKILSAYNYSIQNQKEILSEPIETRYVIDATGNCEIGKICGCEFLNNIQAYPPLEGGSKSPISGWGNTEQKTFTQPFSLRFIMSNIDLKRFSEWLLEFDRDRNVTTAEYIAPHPNPLPKGARKYFIHLSTAYTWDSNREWALKPLFDEAVDKGILKDADRNYFQIFTVAGMPGAVAFNCPRILETQDYTKVLQLGRESILRIFNFCKIYLPGFENAFISNIADELGIRVSNRIKGKYIYTIDDLKSGKKFEHPVVISDYPVDVHSDEKDSSTLEVVQDYQLPVEALMSADVDNLFVVGRCISADFLSQGALRVQPNCFAMGEGLVKYLVNSEL